MTQPDVEPRLHRPWLVAVWPGMGNVALSAGYYLMAKLGMHEFAEFSARELFDVEQVEVHGGLITTASLPRSRLFAWVDPQHNHDIVIFIGEAQPPSGKFSFCQQLIAYARRIGVERVFTFAAMATKMHPEQSSRVFGAATDAATLAELRELEIEVLTGGHISGLNGVLLGAAAEDGMPGACLLGEMPHIFAQLPFPKASQAVLEVFRTLARVELPLEELARQAHEMEARLGVLLASVERQLRHQHPQPEAEAEDPWAITELDEERGLCLEDEMRIDRLFEEAGRDRSKAYELKGLLDELEVFAEYEDRFLDLFRKEA